MKKQKTIIPLILLTIFLTACGSNEVNRISGDVTNLTQENKINDLNQSANSTNPAQETITNQPAHKGYAFSHKGETLAVDADFAPVLSSLGEPRSYFEAESCAFEGLDKIYTYSGFEVNTYPQPNGDFIAAIILKDDTVKTAEGITIGSSRREMESAYGAGSVNDSGQIVYHKDGMKLCFILSGDDVISIEYLSTMLEE
ncbi:MAG: hypothetical protein FWC09_07430 [Lachnospiraceae bacterium]|nr:hypothetical protein [Lachnospiraceae bacterium]